MRCTEKVSYQRRLAALCETWKSEKAVPTVPHETFPFLDEDWSQLWPVFKRWHWARKRHLDKRFCMRRNLLVDWRNVKLGQICELIVALCIGCYHPGGTRMSIFIICLFQFGKIFSYYGSLLLRVATDDIQRVIMLAISKLTILAGF